ncbi:hypothetical protein [Pseudobacteriovorax antillogorgiicola]|uniref:ABC-2 family transporter protein n=1 Tax=Pseudobacteriovorax antillogorgiicola TaxID=1513793 RepID=A0A1Y6CM56_9BACT|nr:hypothetical protein [Pseudobacteriovorax antillogorgiicola]TCS47688.1 hypothetical protein EDD56_120129 [Pseudobacteriovorax antillogorgiicola]SMF59523.1 hypothetical protein SAMN06296036_12011 [Pseudobacteriovorax antillogorgiicola]
MTQLFYTLLWLEARRLRIHITLLLIAFGLLLLWLGIDFGTFSNFEYQFESSGDGSGFMDSLNSLSMETLIAALGIVVPSFSCLAFGSLLLMIAPFRSPQEWQQGHFQMLKMSSWSQYHIQCARFLIYLLLALVFFVPVIATGAMALASDDTINIPYVTQDFIILGAFTVLSSLPLTMAVGMVIDATRTAYYLRGIHFLVTFIQFAGWVALLNLGQKSIAALNVAVLPPIQLKSHQILPPGTWEGPTQLYWEPMIISWIIAWGFAVLSGRIQEEAEA